MDPPADLLHAFGVGEVAGNFDAEAVFGSCFRNYVEPMLSENRGILKDELRKVALIGDFVRV